MGRRTAGRFKGSGNEACVHETFALDCLVSFLAQVDEIVVLSHDVRSWAGEVERIRLLGTFCQKQLI
jgi:hypothetical protein